MTTTTTDSALKTVGFEARYGALELHLNFEGRAAIEAMADSLEATGDADARRVAAGLRKGIANAEARIDADLARELEKAVAPDAYLVASASLSHTFGWGGNATNTSSAKQLHAVDHVRQAVCGKPIRNVQSSYEAGNYVVEWMRSFEAAVAFEPAADHKGWSAREFKAKLCPACLAAVAALDAETLEAQRAFAVDEIARRADERVAAAHASAARRRAAL